jgi:hypothetical protein
MDSRDQVRLETGRTSFVVWFLRKNGGWENLEFLLMYHGTILVIFVFPLLHVISWGFLRINILLFFLL